MSTVIDFLISSYGIVGVLIILLAGLIYLIITQPSLFKKNNEKLTEKVFEAGDKFASTMVEAINHGNEKTSELLERVIDDNNKKTDKLLSYIVNKEAQKEELHDELLTTRLKTIDTTINNNIHTILHSTHSNRVAVLELHNNAENRAGLPFIEYDMTYEAISRGTRPIQQSRVNRNTSILTPVFCDAETSDEIIYRKSDLHNIDNRKNGSSFLFYSLVTELNNEAAIFHVLKDEIGQINGFVVIEFKLEGNFDRFYHKNSIIDGIKEIETLLKLKK